jgi:PTH2 family peptidyl-tRNA hydrolase
MSKKTKGNKIKSTDYINSEITEIKKFESDSYKYKSTNISTKEYTAYLIVNDDLKMSKGKIASQSAHAILNVHRYILSNGIRNETWEDNGEKIVVLKSSSEIIRNLMKEYSDHIPKKNKLNIFPIYDAGKTEIDPGSLTVIATTPITDDIKPDILRTLKLL